MCLDDGGQEAERGQRHDEGAGRARHEGTVDGGAEERLVPLRRRTMSRIPPFRNPPVTVTELAACK
jgi:hypothetical protein